MGSQEVLVERVSGAENGGVGFDQVDDSGKVIENLDVDLLVDDFDSILDGIDDGLTISRMVSEAVTKGMVNAVQQIASEEIAAKEFEVARLKESLSFHHVGSGETESTQLLAIGHEQENTVIDECLSFMDVCVKHDKMRESLNMMRNEAKEQFSTLKKEIGCIRKGSSLQRAGSGSGSGLVGLSGILKEHETGSWVGLDKTVDSLEKTMNFLCSSVDNTLKLSKASVLEWKQEQDFKEEIEEMVMKIFIRSQQEEFETKMWDQQACLHDNQSINWIEKLNEISGLRKELDALMKLFPTSPDHGQLVSHGSVDLDNFLGTPQTPRWEGNGKADVPKSSVPENFDAAQLIHLKKEEMVNYFNTVILKMKREHESEVQDITEKYFFIKGKYLSERRSVLPLTKGKEFELLRKKIPEVILKLDTILVEGEKSPTLGGNGEALGSLRERLDNLFAENCQLRDSLMDKKHELKNMSLQISDASEKMLRYSSVEANLQKVIRNLSFSLEDSHIEAAITEDVYKCVLEELRDQIICTNEESGLRLSLMQDMYGVIIREATTGAKNTSNCEVEDADIESLIKQGLYESILVESLNDGKRIFEELSEKYLLADKNRVSLEVIAKEKEARLRSEIEDNEKLRQELKLLSKTVEEKEKLAVEVSVAFTREKQLVEKVSEELNGLREHAMLQQTLVSKANEEIDKLKGELLETEEKIEADQMEIQSLNQQIEGVMEELREVDVLKKLAPALTQEKENCSLLLAKKEKEHMDQIKALIPLVEGLSDKIVNLECQVSGDIKTNNLRLENSCSELRSLIKKANVLRQTEFHYRQRLERRCADLQMAEAEVDLLGDEVETLVSLLEKIYIALDHYSPVLRHYPGVMEILKLVRRELSAEPVKPV